jgi:hypothetical protein
MADEKPKAKGKSRLERQLERDAAQQVEPQPQAPREPRMSASAFIESASLKRVEADLVRSLCLTEKHTSQGWRDRLAEILARPVGGNE